MKIGKRFNCQEYIYFTYGINDPNFPFRFPTIHILIHINKDANTLYIHMTLTVILGCMYAGKTETVISYARRYRAIEKKVLFINHSIDDRYSQEQKVVSHNGTREDCIKVPLLEGIQYMNSFKDANVVIIEEAQFFSDLLEFFYKLDLSSKDFIVSGLAGDFKMRPIGDILALIPMAEFVEKINGLCKYCKDGTVGAFTRKTSSSQETVQVGGMDLYECVCRIHHKVQLN